MRNLYKKETFKPEIKPMIQNVQDGLYQLKNKQAKGAKLRANISQEELEGKKCPKTFFNILERLNMQNQTIFELYTDDNKSKQFSNPTDILKSAQKIMKKSTPSKLSQLLQLNFLEKLLIERKCLMSTLILYIYIYISYITSLDEIIKSIN